MKVLHELSIEKTSLQKTALPGTAQSQVIELG